MLKPPDLQSNTGNNILTLDPIQQTIATTVQAYINHPEIDRNKAIAAIKFLNEPKPVVQIKELRGIVIAACERHGAALPIFEERQGFFIVTFNPRIAEAAEKTSKAPVTAPVTAPVLRLLEILFSKGILGNVEILAELGLKNRRRMRENYIAPALEAKLIEYTIPEKPNSRLQKYRLTPAGREILEKKDLEGRLPVVPGRAKATD